MSARVSEERRLREVRKYHAPAGTRSAVAELCAPGPAALASAVSSPNRPLTALMQLVARRLGMQRAMVSVVEQHAQYFLAESTRTLNLDDLCRQEDGDFLWKGCGWTQLSEALCANTIELSVISGQHACFSVCDLSKDKRFCNLPYVAESPHFRFYAGTPLLTKDNIPIGSVFVIDDRPRGPPTKFEVDFLAVMARNVMDYLEMRRESEMRIRNERMIKCLAAFVDGKATAPENIKSLGHEMGVLPQVIETNGATGEPARISEQAQRRARSSMPDHSLSSDNMRHSPLQSDETTDTENGNKKLREETQHQILARASKLLREALEVDRTIFLDLATTSSSLIEDGRVGAVDTSDESHWDGEPQAMSQPNGIYATTTASRIQIQNISQTSKASSRENRDIKVCSFATASASSHNGDNLGTDIMSKAVNIKCLRSLLKRYPQGRLWTFDDAGVGSSSEDDIGSKCMNAPPNPSAKLKDTALLAHLFPGVRQVLFAPLWDVETSTHIAACFAVTSNPIPVLDNDADVAFMRGFLNSVSITCSRAIMAAANRQKGNFISSISHELRSPLHGILASAELLADSKLDNFQTELCGTIETCGQALLETITDILEYTKINSLRKDAHNAYNTKYDSKYGHPKDLKTSTHAQPDPAAPSTFDLAKLCEDAVVAISAAYMYHTTNPEQLHYRVFLPPGVASDVHLPPKSRSFVVVVNVTPGDWGFFGFSGFINRIIMNLVGNSLKYTHAGSINLSLSQEPLPPDSRNPDKLSSDTSMVNIVITDTGRGISKDFLQTKLFTPFSQESTLAPGTGLGLNIVRSLVELQQGKIDIISEVGVGTSVIVRLPLQRSKLTENPERSRSGILAVSPSHPTSTFLFQGFASASSKQTKESLRQYLTSWFHMKEVQNTGGAVAEIVVVDEEECSKWIKTSRQQQKLIIVCDQSRQKQLLQAYSGYITPFELVTTPFGPHKLSKALIACLEKPSPTVDPKAFMGNDTTSDDKLSISQPLPIRNETKISALAVAPPPMSQSPSRREQIPKPIISATGRGRVLCVDDNAINLRLLRSYMDKLGFRDVACAENGAIAFECVRQHPEKFDLIFMDLSMPVCNGFKCTSMIRSLEKLQLKIPQPGNHPQSPALIVAVTGLASQSDQDAATAAGIDYFLSKPLKLSTLKEHLIDWGFLEWNL